jgi:threonine dehydrogenase-like Zn-dependent dehydrogenase
MKAIRLSAEGPSVVDHPQPPAIPGEAIIRPTLVGVCSTDLELCKGYMAYEGVLGHEFVGVVESVSGPKGQKWVGKRVVGTINCACGCCDMCMLGWREHCRGRTVLGIFRRDGCFAERFSLPVFNLLEVPDSVPDDEAVFAEPLAAAIEITTQKLITAQDRITVLGDGRLGLLCAQVLAKLNPHVRLVGKHAQKLMLARKLGLTALSLDDALRLADQDVVVDATGSPTGLPAALTMVRPRGTVFLKTTVAPNAVALAFPAGIDLSPIVIHEVRVQGSRCGPLRPALKMLADRAVDVRSLISHRMKLEEGVDALAAAKSPNAVKVLMEV